MTKKAKKPKPPTSPFVTPLRCLDCHKKGQIYGGFCWDCKERREDEMEAREDSWG